MIYQMSKKERLLFYVAVIFVGCAVVSRMALHPAIAKSASLNREIKLKKRMIEDSLRLLSQKEVIQKESGKYAGYIKQKLSEEQEVATLLKEIEDIAKDSQIQLIDLKPYSAKRGDFYTEYKVEVETEAEMNQLMTFIYNLQSSGGLLKVTKFSISPRVDKINTLKAQLAITKIFIP